MTFLTQLRKELMEQWRTHRFLILAAILVVFGLASPLLAKLTPEILASVPGLPPELAQVIPSPTLTDAVTQYEKNMSQFGLLLALLMSMGLVVQEKERGTAPMLLTHPVSRGTFLLAKFAALAVTFTVSLALAALGCWYYTLLLFEALPWGPFLAFNGLMLVVFLVYVALTLLASTLARNQTTAAGIAFAVLVVLGVIGVWPTVAEVLPTHLFSWGSSLALGGTETAWPALWVSLGLIAFCLLLTWLIFRRQEL